MASGISCIRDLALFIRAIRDNRLMGEAASRELLSPHIKPGDVENGSLWNGFGFEFDLDDNGETIMFGKDGINPGVASICTYYPPSDTTCVILANQDCDVWAMHEEIGKVIA